MGQGYECLKVIASVLSQIPNKEQDIVARYGGEEFVILLYGCRNSASFANRVLDSVRYLPQNYASKIKQKVTVSIGVASIIGSDESSSSTLFEAADCALYEAKSKGKDRVQVSHLEALNIQNKNSLKDKQ
ncbi:GGDEF domain-containing protein [Vibrio mediterranei]|uniref:GGDEF domain-containing protein n=1 Tax=Vibrio mediterranei TaxID=689 RepID=UPI00148C2DF0|nr:GGDEF domain-containing protein [Vibrio mediterranei]NOI26989.1 GGDEF domain-containing protein [Vibrio mediterranei]